MSLKSPSSRFRKITKKFVKMTKNKINKMLSVLSLFKSHIVNCVWSHGSHILSHLKSRCSPPPCVLLWKKVAAYFMCLLTLTKADINTCCCGGVSLTALLLLLMGLIAGVWESKIVLCVSLKLLSFPFVLLFECVFLSCSTLTYRQYIKFAHFFSSGITVHSCISSSLVLKLFKPRFVAVA